MRVGMGAEGPGIVRAISRPNYLAFGEEGHDENDRANDGNQCESVKSEDKHGGLLAGW